MINMEELYREVKGKWNSLYPIYFDSTKSMQEGRRLPKQLCVENPTIEELSKAVGLCQLRNILEPHKCYPRDYFSIGRLKVEMLNDQGKPIHQEIFNKKKLMQKTAEKLRLFRHK